MRGLDTNTRLTILSSKDVFIAIFLLLVGIFVVLLGFSINESIVQSYTMYIYVSGMGSSSPLYNPSSISTPAVVWIPGWIVVMLGITTILYGIKRILDDILKIVILRNK